MSRQQENGTVPNAPSGGLKPAQSPLFKVYLYSIIALGLAATVFSCYRLFHGNTGLEWMALASLTLLTGAFTVKIPGTEIKISVAETFILTNLLLFGPAIGCITAALDGLIGSLRCKTTSRRPLWMLFNMAVMGLSGLGAGGIFTLAHRRAFLAHAETLTLGLFVPLALMALVYYLINTVAVAAIVGLERRQNIYDVWRKNFFWLAANYLTAALVAGLLALNTEAITSAILGVRPRIG